MKRYPHLGAVITLGLLSPWMSAETLFEIEVPNAFSPDIQKLSSITLKSPYVGSPQSKTTPARKEVDCLSATRVEGIPSEFLDQRRWFGRVLNVAKELAKKNEPLKSAVERLWVTSISENYEQSWADCRILLESGDSRLVSMGVLVAGTFEGLDEWLKGIAWKKEHAEGLVFAMEEMLPLVEGRNLGEGGGLLCFRADFYIGTLGRIFGVEFTGSLPARTAEVREWVVAELDKLWQVVDDAKSKNELRAWIALIRDSPRATEELELNDEIKAMIIRGESVTHLMRKRVYPPERPLVDGNAPVNE